MKWLLLIFMCIQIIRTAVNVIRESKKCAASGVGCLLALALHVWMTIWLFNFSGLFD